MDRIEAYDPTLRQRASSKLQGLLSEYLGYNNYRAGDVARRLTGADGGVGGSGMGIADITPLGALFAVQEGGLQAGEGVARIERGDLAGGGLMSAVGALAAFPGVGPAVKASKVAGKAAKGSIAANAEARALAAAIDTDYLGPSVQGPRAVNVADRFAKGASAGTYRGTTAFGGITPQKLGSMRAGYMQKMEEGAPARHWYDESSADIHRWTGGVPSRSDDMANILATTSANTPVGSNLMYANKGWNQRIVGDPIKTGQFPNSMGATIDSYLANPAQAELGLKRSPFSAGLSVDWRGPEFASRPTHDIHDVRAWGITDPKTGALWDKGVPNAGHRFLDDQAAWVTDKANRTNLGGADDWNAYRAQAAAWISQKAKTDGTPISTAQAHYGTLAPEYQGLISREWTPGENTGHLPELVGGSDAARRQYGDALEEVLRGRMGVDRLASDAGALTDTTMPNLGIYEGSTNPGYLTRINVGKAPGSQSMDASSQKVMDAVASMHGLLGQQKQVANNFRGGETSLKEAGSIRFPGDNSDARLLDLNDTLRQMGVQDPAVMRDPSGGIRALNWMDGGERQALAKAVTPRVPKWVPQGLLDVEPPTFHANSGNLIPFNAPDAWSSKPFIEAIDAAGPFGEKLSRAAQPIAGEILAKVNTMSAQNGWTQAPWFRPMMEGLRDGGLDRLKELVRQGVVPAVALTAIGGMAAAGGQQDGPN